MMKRKKSALAMALLLPAAFITAFLMAASVSYAADNTVTYDGGNKLKETNTELAIPVVPGSAETTEIMLLNSTESSTNWYMSSEVLKSVEDANKDATGAAYTYTLAYTAPDGTDTVIYDSSRVGGMDSQGLLEVNESLGEGYFFLGNLGKDQAGTVSLTIGLNGESAVNNYQTMKGTLQTGFAVEVVPEGTSGSGSVNTVTRVEEVQEQTELTGGTGQGDLTDLTETDVIRTGGRPKTGDNSRILFYVMLALTAGIGCMVFGIGLFRREREEGEESNEKA